MRILRKKKERKELTPKERDKLIKRWSKAVPQLTEEECEGIKEAIQSWRTAPQT